MSRSPRVLPKRRWRKRVRFLAGVGIVYVLTVGGGCMNLSLPTDLLLNLTPTPAKNAERKATEPTLVVLQHGLWRSWGSLWRLERALRQHGYEVLNFSYPSTRDTIEAHATRLARRIETYLDERNGEPPRLCFVGHSLGGLVIRSYLQREVARAPWACVFMGTPHRGAIRAQLVRKHWWFRCLMGKRSGLQLVPGDSIYTRLGTLACSRIGVIYGGKGDDAGWNEHIPGDDDGTVAVLEAQLPEQTASVRLRQGHTRLSFSADAIRQTLAFLRQGRFED